MPADLEIEFAGSRWVLSATESIEFGRGAQIDLDDNQYLHRQTGRFEHRNGLWMVLNTGRSIHLTISDEGTGSQATVAPGREFAVTFSPARVRVRAGQARYELVITTEILSSFTGGDGLSGGDTITSTGVPMTPDQFILVVALAERALREPGQGIRVSASKTVAERLGWSVTKFNRKLDNVCSKLAKAGVPGLHGGLSGMATDRRLVLVQFALQSGFVGTDDLSLLDRDRPSAS